ncbi:beta-ketoacyl synthase [Microseira wollei NIES-4236]|uniref:Beta-ketoacyl synthase n=1 Tax=Microseira wollei NIES-4236 TaxID=2530354 RepID=A0AAV3X786_9CYAN|nr:type I polyketide synthase [Microseira wollei]GET37655.1 beta-ketoacyl synthase [Microseira wollei NIES-4236]
MREGIESISSFYDEELVVYGIDREVLSQPNYVKAGAILEDIEWFDAAFFGFNPREAATCDPQHRLFLECAWEALENAGYNSETYTGQIGTYAGTGWSSYLFNNLHSNREFVESVGGYQTLIGNDKDFLATRVAYKLNLTGPSINIQTACSTSLVAISTACQSLLNYQCDMALAGGVSVFVPHKAGYFYQEGGILSPDGHCRAFDAKAGGTVIGNGAGIVVLKRLEDALADGDRIDAVIKGFAINNDGAGKVGYTAPSVDGQSAAIAQALALAGIEPEAISYIETHGTATALGDPIEIAALTQAFRTSTNRPLQKTNSLTGETPIPQELLEKSNKRGFCAIGSVKTNIGHLDAAAGVTGLIKTVLALKHEQIPPSLHFEQPNPKINFTNSPFYVNTKLSEWKRNGTPRRAGVSSFGIGGTNAHVILEESPIVKQQETPKAEERKHHLLILSARTSSALATARANLAAYLQQHRDLNLADVAYTLQVGRKMFDHRQILVCENIDDAVKALSTLDAQRILTQFNEQMERPIAFMFSGQGSQYVNMGRELYQNQPIFKAQIDCCAELLKPHLKLDLRDILYPNDSQSEAAIRPLQKRISKTGGTPIPQEYLEKSIEQLKQTYITQPALFAIEYALAQLWMAWGVHPQALIGHSIGEYVAATIAGVFTLEEALKLVAIRGQLMQQLPTGKMLSVALSEEEVKPLLGDELAIAAINSDRLCVVSGAEDAIARLQDRLTSQNINCRQLHTSHAFHSAMMNPIVETFAEEVKKVNLKSPKIPFISNVTGTWITAAEAVDPNYWAKHLRETVRFAAGIAELLKQPRILLEIGPGRTLSTFAKQHHNQEQIVLTSVRHPQDLQSDMAFLLNTLGRLWLAGVQIDWSGFYAKERRYRVPLPTYPFERQRYWIEPKEKTNNSSNYVTKIGKKTDVSDWFYLPSWKRIELLQTEQPLQQSCWLVFVDESGVGWQIVNRLKQQGHDVVTVMVGEQFNRISHHLYTINPQNRDDWEALLKELQMLGKVPNAIAHLWSLIPNAQTRSPQQFFERCQHLGLYSLLYLTQALSQQRMTHALQMTVVTNNVHDVTGEEDLCPEKATVLATCKVIPQEYQNIRCRVVDVAISDEIAANKLADKLIVELTAQPPETIVAYRGKHRWVETFEPARLNQTIDGTAKLREQGVYLIAGALGDVSLMLGEYLAQTVRAKLILIEHPDFPDRDEWGKRKIQAIEQLSPEVLFISADVANEAQMEQAIGLSLDRFGEIHGVIYAAEKNDEKSFRPIQQTTINECQWHFQPKVHGLFVLEKVLQGIKLYFCVLQSSISSLVGGFFAHCAANIFMDAFVRKHNQTNSIPWISINWEGWQFWEERQITPTGTTAEWALLPKEGVEAFQKFLSIGQVDRIVVCTTDLQARINQQELKFIRQTEPLKQADSSLHPRGNLPNAYVAPTNEIEQAIANLWQELLGIEKVGIYDNFFELGGHSLLAVQTVSRIREIFQVDLPLRNLIFDTPTIAGLAEVIAEKQPRPEELDEIARLLQEVENLSPDEIQAQLAN